MMGRVALVGAGAAAVLALVACSNYDTKKTDGRGSPAPGTRAAQAGAQYGDGADAARAVKVVATAEGKVLAGPNGHTLYTYDPDKAEPNTSACNEECAVDWPPLIGSARAAQGVDPADLATATRSDGSKQVSYQGHPVYYYVNDAKPGDTTGDGVGGVWHVVPVDRAGSGGDHGGYHKDSKAVVKVSWASTVKGKALVGPNGQTLYTFDPDKANKNTSACNGKCAVTWPPLIGTPTVGKNITPDEVATITRADGSKQVTWCGHPLYFYAKDTAPGDVNGDGVGGVWHIVTP